MRCTMGLLKLVIVDDEPILLEGLVKTYDWNGMGYEVVGFAQSGEQALKVIREKKPHVVLTDIRMKQISGLMVMEEIKKENPECQFVVLSAYRDFEYAKKACDLGAFAYLLKPIEDEKLQATMTDVGKICEDQIRNEEKYDRWERLLKKDGDGFLQVVVQKYVQNRLPEEKVDEVFHTLQDVMKEGDRFITVYADLDLAYKITNELEYEASRFSMVRMIEEKIAERFTYWKFESEEGHRTFIIKTQENTAVHELKELLEEVKKEENSPVIAAISKPYKGIRGIRRSFEEAQRLFAVTNASGAGVFTIPETVEEKEESPYPAEAEMMVVNSVRKNDAVQLKQAFVHFIYQLPHREELQCQYMHKIMVKTEFMLKDSYGMDESLNQQFENYYSNMRNLKAAKAVDVCYKILGTAIEKRLENAEKKENKGSKEYIAAAVAYIDEHLDNEDLTIVSVATHVYLNPVYFGRVFKNTFHMTFKQYLLQRRMELAKRLLEDGRTSIGNICEQVGISNPSYFSHLFKEYTGQLPRDYKREYEV